MAGPLQCHGHSFAMAVPWHVQEAQLGGIPLLQIATLTCKFLRGLTGVSHSLALTAHDKEG